MSTAAGPVYRRVLDDLRTQIRDGVLRPGARVPSRNGIIARYGVGETAAKHALRVLASEGLIETRAGSGSYVRRAPAAGCLEHDRPQFPGSPFGLAEPHPDGDGGRAEGVATVVAWEHQTEQVAATQHVARKLALGEQELVTRTRYLLTADGSPVQVVISHEPAALTAGTPVALPEEGPLAGRGVVERMAAVGVGVDEVIEDISVRPSLAEEANALGVPAGAAVLAVEREHRAGGRIVEFSEIAIPAERYRLRYRLAPGAAGAADAAGGAGPADAPAQENGAGPADAPAQGNGAGPADGPGAEERAYAGDGAGPAGGAR